MIGLLLVAGLLNPRADLLLGAIDVPIDPFTVAAAELTEARALEVAGDLNQRRYLRMRAVAALGVFASDAARATIEDFAAHDTDVEVRIQAVIMLARRFGVDAPGRITAQLLALRPAAPPALARVIRAEVDRLNLDRGWSPRPPARSPAPPAR